MPKIKTSELTGPALDWAVANCENVQLSGANLGFQVEKHGTVVRTPGIRYSPSADWALAGPIIEREGVQLFKVGIHLWRASFQNYAAHEQHDNSPLIAAMRCYVASKLGDLVEIPSELTKGL